MTNGTSDTQQHASRDTKQPRHIRTFLGFADVPNEFQQNIDRFERMWGALLIHRWHDAQSMTHVQDQWRAWLSLNDWMQGAMMALLTVGHVAEANVFSELIDIAEMRRESLLDAMKAGTDRTGI